MPWDTNRPKDTDQLRDLPAEWQSSKSYLDNYLQSFVYWSDSAASAGVPRMSTTTAALGTGRIIAAPRSQVSTRARTDLFYVTDERRLVYMDTSGNSVAIGGADAVVSYTTLSGTQANQPTLQNNSRVVVCSGSATTSSSAQLTTQVTFPVTYTNIPMVLVSSGATDDASAASFVVSAGKVTTSGCSLMAYYVGSGSTVNAINWYWRSVGTVSV
jgi:hypothetical protein